MIVRRGSTIGVCMGVQRALEMVEEAKNERPREPLATIGPIIHNRRVLEKLAADGVEIIKTPAEARGGTVVIRAHGLSAAEKAAFARRPVRLLDGTCPLVEKSQKLAEAKSREGFRVLIAGDAGHAEVIGIAGYAGDCQVLADEAAAEACGLGEKAFVIAQTTIRQDKYDAICRVLRRRAEKEAAAGESAVLEIAQTICPATRIRQEAVKDLVRETDAVLVIGGRNSANTGHLYETARLMGKPVWHIEGAAEIPKEIFTYKTVGLSAGASTPEWIIREVEDALLRQR